jgi:hypothetical protein
MSVPANSLYLYTYTLLQHFNSTHPLLSPNISIAASAFGAELVSGLLWTPMELLKTRMIVSTPSSCKSELDHLRRAVSDVLREPAGYRGFMRGYTISLCVFVPQSIVYFLIYEHLKTSSRLTDTRETSFWRLFACSAVAGACASVVSHPLDTLRTRWQVESRCLFKHFVESVQWRTLYRGMAARVLWMSPSTALSMALFDTFVRRDRDELRRDRDDLK